MVTGKALEEISLRRKANVKMAALGLVLALVSLPGSAMAEEVTGYYIGNKAHNLGDTTNWKGGIRPGRFAEDGVTNGFFGGTMIFDDQATGWGVNLYTHNPPMISVSNMIFRGAAVSKSFLIPDGRTIWFESGGRLEIEADSEKTLTFGTSSYLKIRDVENVGEYVDIINHSTAHPLNLGSIGNTQVSTSQLKPEFRFSGEGDIVFSQNSNTPNGYNANGQGSAVVLVFNQTGTFKHNGQHDTYADAIIVPPSDSSRRIELNEHGFRLLRDGDDVGPSLDIGADTVITGSKGLDFGQYKVHSSRITVAEGKTLVLDMGTLTTSYSGGVKGIWFEGDGTTVFTASVTNTAEKVYIEKYATVKSPIVGAAWSETSPMGTNACISLANSGRFVYTGAGETTDRGFEIRYASAGYLEQAGTGPLVITGNFNTPNSGTSTLLILNDTEQDVTYSGMLADNGSGKLAITKQGSGLWRINCAATYTGATKVEGGTLALGASGSIAASALTLQGGRLCVENAGASFASLTLAANTANGLSVADGVSYTLPAFTRNSGATLDVSLGTGAELTVTGVADGKTPAWLTVDGASGMIVGGKVKTVSDITHAIDARGGVIPDNPAAIVGITTAVGAGVNVTLEKPETTVGVVNQMQGQSAEIALNSGETLNVVEIVVSEGAGNLAVTSSGSATVAGLGSDPVSLNPAAGTVLSLSGDLNVAAAEIKGGGTVSLDTGAGIGDVTTSGSPTLAVPSSSFVHLDSWTNSNAVAEFAGPGALSVADLALGGADADDSSLTISGGTVTNSAGLFRKGSGYLRLDGGTFVETGTGNPAWGPSPSQVTFEQAGGVYRHEGQFVIGGWDSQLSIYLSGGQFTINGTCEFPTWNAGCNRYTENGNRLNYILTVDGESAFKAGTVNMGRINTGAAYSNSANEWANPTMINFNGGTGDVWLIQRGYTKAQSPSSRAFVNFNGGTLKTTNKSGAFGSGAQAVDRVTVFAGGCTFDTDGRNIASSMPISAPYGNGVAIVPVPAEVLAGTFAAPPSVAIIGDGEGASARVLFNPATGKVTGVQVLTPGWGYTSAKARFNHGGYTCIGESAVELEAVECGQFVKAGSGAYTFNCVNTVTDVKVTGGSIKNGVNDVFPSNVTLTLDGGNYDMNNFSQTFKSITYGLAGGAILNGTATTDELVIDFGEAVAGRAGVADLSHVAFSAQAKVVLNGYDPSALESVNKVVLLRYAQGGAPASVPSLDGSVVLPKGWSLQASQTNLKLARETGFAIIFR